MGEVRQTPVKYELTTLVSTPDGIPPGWEILLDGDREVVLRKKPREKHWTELLASWPSQRPSYIVEQTDYKHKIVFITDGFGRKLLGLPFSTVEALYNEVSRG